MGLPQDHCQIWQVGGSKWKLISWKRLWNGNCSNPGDSPETTMRNKTTEFLTDAAERIIVMTKVYTRWSFICSSFDNLLQDNETIPCLPVLARNSKTSFQRLQGFAFDFCSNQDWNPMFRFTKSAKLSPSSLSNSEQPETGAFFFWKDNGQGRAFHMNG